MNLGSVATAILIAVIFIGWPIIGKYSQASGAWVSTIVLLSTTLVAMLFSWRKLTSSLPTTKAFAILTIAGVINGWAVYLYAQKATDPNVSTGTFVITIAVLSVLIAPVLDWGLNGSVPTAQKVAGFVCGAVAIYLLK